MNGCRVLDKDEVAAILAELNPRDRLLVLTGLTFGTRIGETLALTFGDVAGDFLYIRSEKGSRNTTFEIPADYRAAVAALHVWYQERGVEVTDRTVLFRSQKGGAITRQASSAIIKATCHRLGIGGKVNSHSFRKCFVTAVYELSGRDIAQTKHYSRHKSLASLDHYISTTQTTGLVSALRWGK